MIIMINFNTVMDYGYKFGGTYTVVCVYIYV